MRKEINDKNTHLLPEWLYNVERKLDGCNHLMEMLRTVLGLCTLALQVVILLKLFNII
jgi:hypothetical protein